MPHSEENLLDQIESLYRGRFADFVAVAASIVGERESAREAVQDAFASVVRSRRDFRGDAPLRTRDARPRRDPIDTEGGGASSPSRPSHET